MADQSTSQLLQAIDAFEQEHGGDDVFQQVCDTLKQAVGELDHAHSGGPAEPSPGHKAAQDASKEAQAPEPPADEGPADTASEGSQEPPPAKDEHGAPNFKGAKAEGRKRFLKAMQQKHG